MTDGLVIFDEDAFGSVENGDIKIRFGIEFTIDFGIDSLHDFYASHKMQKEFTEATGNKQLANKMMDSTAEWSSKISKHIEGKLRDIRSADYQDIGCIGIEVADRISNNIRSTNPEYRDLISNIRYSGTDLDVKKEGKSTWTWREWHVILMPYYGPYIDIRRGKASKKGPSSGITQADIMEGGDPSIEYSEFVIEIMHWILTSPLQNENIEITDAPVIADNINKGWMQADNTYFISDAFLKIEDYIEVDELARHLVTDTMAYAMEKA